MTRRFNTSRKLSFQALEDRSLMTGNVAVSVQNGVLNITGDNQANAIEIQQVGNGQYKIFNTDGNTTINGQLNGQVFSGVTSDFKIDMKGGNDSLSMNGGDKDHRLVVPRNLNVKTGAGDDWFLSSCVSVRGGATIDAGSENNFVKFEFSDIGNSSVNSGKNDVVVKLGNGTKQYVDFGEFSSVERDFSIQGNNASGDTTVYMDYAAVGRDAKIQTGNGNDRIEVNFWSAIGGKLDVRTNGGNDSVALGESWVPSSTNKTVNQYGMYADQVFVDLGKGNDDVHLFGVTANSGKYQGGDGNDTFYNNGGNTGSISTSKFEFTV